MGFQIHGLQRNIFAHLFKLTDEQLAAQNIVRQTVTEYPGTPCRVSMQDIQTGESVLLLNYKHQPADSPYQSSHAIFVAENAEEPALAANVIPEVIHSRLISVRAFNQAHIMVDADVAKGKEIAERIEHYFKRGEIAYLHLHNAGPGCFAASVEKLARDQIY